jgi:D-serine deaminase-like pyridoxal phosphate-dependent protein
MPTLLLDKQKCLQNIEKMARKAAGQKLSLRPHCKTHQSAEIGSWLREYGVSSITVSSFNMARYFAEAGWDDILVAFPFQPGESDKLNALSEKCKLSILVDTSAALPFLHHIPKRVGLYIDIDTGYGRTGVKAENPELIEQIILKAGANPNLEFRGFYCHAGHSYKAGNREDLNSIHRKALSDLNQLKKRFATLGPGLLLGDTPNCSIQEEFGGIDEITPGNFIFYDLIQSSLGACSMDEIAVAMECPVAGRYPSDERIVIHGGAVHFSKESMHLEETTIFGKLVQRTGEGWTKHADNRYLTSISQEHGVLEHCGALVREVNIGDLLLFMPVHSCLTANLAAEYVTTTGKRITNIHSMP